MCITLYSFLMALIWSSVFVTLLLYFRGKTEFFYTFGTSSILLLFAGFAIRLVLPIEFPFVKEIGLYDGLYATIDSFIRKDICYGITILDLAIVIWVVVSIALLVNLIVKHILFTRAMLKIDNSVTPQMIECQKRLESELNVKNSHIICSSRFDAPMCFGIKKLILLPELDYKDEELYYILKHEFIHFKNKDFYLKLLIEVYIAILWWNPFVYLLRHNLSHILEIKCDLAVVGNESRDAKLSYLSTIYKIVKIKTNKPKKAKDLRLATAEFSDNLKNDRLVQRFEIIKAYVHNKRKSFLCFICFIIVMILTLSFSYMFVLQPAITAPQDEIVENEGEFEITPENTYILVTEDGRYILVSDNGTENEIDEAFKDMLILDGFEIMED